MLAVKAVISNGKKERAMTGTRETLTNSIIVLVLETAKDKVTQGS